MSKAKIVIAVIAAVVVCCAAVCGVIIGRNLTAKNRLAAKLDGALQHGGAAEHRRKSEWRGGQGRGGEEGEREEASFHVRKWGKRLRMARNSTIFARRSQDRRAS